MPRQVPFTEYEAALLLDAYLKTLSGEKERMESVRDCSLQLRQMALNAGSEIDDIYRNVNGISFQMASMESAYQGHTIMKPATRLFTEIVFLYRNDAARYRQLLKEAKGMASAKIDNEAVFMAWLAQNVSGIQLSELYLAFKEIEQQAKKVKIIRTSLYESLDPSTIKKVKAGVESSKIFKFTHKHQWGRITSALNYLLQFASQKATETQTQETARVEMVESVKELEIVPSPDISSNAIRISHKWFASKGGAKFSVKETDAIIDRFCDGDYIPLQDVKEFALFPESSFPWTEYLLEQYVAFYSEKFYLMHGNYNKNCAVGAIVRKTCRFDSFDDLVTDILAHNDVSLQKKAVLDYLVENGYIARRSYTNIETIMINARAMRNQKEK